MLIFLLITVSLCLAFSSGSTLHRVAINTSQTTRDGPPKQGRQKFNEPQSLLLAQDLDLFASCLDTGLALSVATRVIADFSDLPQWQKTASLLGIGIPPVQAWDELASIPGAQEISVLTKNSERSGAALASGMRRIAETLREESLSQATARAERAGVLIAIPLALCFLPAFMVLGLAPIVISLGIGVF